MWTNGGRNWSHEGFFSFQLHCGVTVFQFNCQSVCIIPVAKYKSALYIVVAAALDQGIPTRRRIWNPLPSCRGRQNATHNFDIQSRKLYTSTQILHSDALVHGIRAQIHPSHVISCPVRETVLSRPRSMWKQLYPPMNHTTADFKSNPNSNVSEEKKKTHTHAHIKNDFIFLFWLFMRCIGFYNITSLWKQVQEHFQVLPSGIVGVHAPVWLCDGPAGVHHQWLCVRLVARSSDRGRWWLRSFGDSVKKKVNLETQQAETS